MITFQWNRNFLTSIASVDEQHHHLVDLINLLGDRLGNDQVCEADLQQMFKELVDYAGYHFAEEEALMNEVGVDPTHIRDHTESHQTFYSDIQLLKLSEGAHVRQIGSALLDYLVHWLTYHILGQDQSMARQIKAIRAGQSPRQALEAQKKEMDGALEPLLAALNELLAQLSARNKELLELNRSLELRVEQRTRALSEANKKLEALSLRDSLTGLSNRRHAMLTLEKLWDECEAVAALMIDADNFKQVNDRHGHQAGDGVLIEIGRTLRHFVRTDDLVFRLGGDEFLVLCPNTGLAGALKIAEQLRQRVADLRVAAGDGFWNGSVSIGVATRNEEMRGIGELLHAADERVYCAKNTGKNRVCTVANAA